jgi:hypothetical protein
MTGRGEKLGRKSGILEEKYLMNFDDLTMRRYVQELSFFKCQIYLK